MHPLLTHPCVLSRESALSSCCAEDEESRENSPLLGDGSFSLHGFNLKLEGKGDWISEKV